MRLKKCHIGGGELPQPSCVLPRLTDHTYHNCTPMHRKLTSQTHTHTHTQKEREREREKVLFVQCFCLQRKFCRVCYFSFLLYTFCLQMLMVEAKYSCRVRLYSFFLSFHLDGQTAWHLQLPSHVYIV